MSTYQKCAGILACAVLVTAVLWGLYAFGGARILPADLSGYDKVVVGSCIAILFLAMWLFQPREEKFLMAICGVVIGMGAGLVPLGMFLNLKLGHPLFDLSVVGRMETATPPVQIIEGFLMIVGGFAGWTLFPMMEGPQPAGGPLPVLEALGATCSTVVGGFIALGLFGYLGLMPSVRSEPTLVHVAVMMAETALGSWLGYVIFFWWRKRRRLVEKCMIVIIPFGSAYLVSASFTPDSLALWWGFLGLIVTLWGCIAVIALAKGIPDQGWDNFSKTLPGAAVLFVVTLVVRAVVFKLIPVLSLVPTTLTRDQAEAVVVAYAGTPVLLTWWLWIKSHSREDDGSRASVSGLLDGAVTFATGGKSVLGGLWFGFWGGALLWWAVPALLAAFTSRAAAPSDWALPVIGGAVGGYWFLARGVGPMLGVFGSWSNRDVNKKTLGAARFASRDELRDASVLQDSMTMPKGLYLGEYHESGVKTGVLRYPDRSHLATIGPTGSGKGMGVICANLGDPNLRRSVLVIDPKAQIAAITARKRARMGRVVMLNPYMLLAETHKRLRSNGFNPLAKLDLRSPFFVAEVTKLADAIVQIEANTTQKHFPESARDLVAALIMWECLTAERESRTPTLGNVRAMLGQSFMMKDNKPYGLLDTMSRISVCQDPHIGASIRAKAAKFENTNAEIQNVISDALTQTKFLDDPSIRDDLALDGFDFDDMKKDIVTVYLILPTAELKSQSVWMRLIVTAALNSLLRSLPAADLPPVLLVLDEFFQLNLPNFDNTISIARDHGVQLWMILQNLGQLEKIYGNAYQNMLSGCAATTFFKPRHGDMFTAEHLSKMCGSTTVVTAGENRPNASGQPGKTSGQSQRPFILPEEFQSRLNRNEMICFVDGVVHPFKSTVPHYMDTPFKEGLDDNPYYVGT